MDRGKSKGYVFAICQDADDPYIPNALHVERDDECVPWRYKTDEDAARGAERDGVKMLYGIPHVEDGIYLDTPENRQLLNDYSANIQREMRRPKNHNKGYDR